MGHIPHLYIPGPWEEPSLHLSQGQRHHLHRVLRISDGAAVSYTDGRGRVGSGRIEGESVLRGGEREIPRPSLLWVAVPPPGSRDRTRYLVEKLAEVGVSRLLWVDTRRSEGRKPPASKAEAWACSALEQSRGAWLMEMGEASLDELEPSRLVVADPEGGDVEAGTDDILLVGPEGGWDHTELPEGVRRLRLGPTILRVETAAVAGAVLLGARSARRG
ncbi:MAG: RsmE family RNA methyltransferase [Actinomycetota bacterium]